MEIYEYKIENIDAAAPHGDDLQDHLSGFGKEGWELVGVVAAPEGGREWYFKRVRMKAV